MVACSLAAAAQVAAPAAPGKTQINRLFAKNQIEEKIVKPPQGLLKYPYLVPSGPYHQLFDWDSYFMGVALSYGHQGQPLATSVEDFLSFVGRHAADTGYTPREIAPTGFWALPEMCKPFLAQAAYRASLTMGSVEWLRPWYQRLAATLQFWENTREQPNGLFVWFNGVESGVDNNPAVSDRPAEVAEGVDLECYLFREYEAMAILADKLGYSKDAAEYRDKAAALKTRIQTLMWSESAAAYLNVDARTGKQIDVLTWTDFVPLWAGVATRTQARQMVEEHLLNPKEFWAPYGIRTLAPNQALYDPVHGYWRGPVWILPNYLLMHGLMNYGYRRQALELAARTEKLLVRDLKATGGMNECYNPDTGKPEGASHFVSWDLLGEHMLEEAKTGQDPTVLKMF
ncbi:MAG TPA: trehalase family glycosidase [Acidobacteriaceae bacterium]|nr:trehalase family glycosidase [Acidobacteriaceae bacterium]